MTDFEDDMPAAASLTPYVQRIMKGQAIGLDKDTGVAAVLKTWAMVAPNLSKEDREDAAEDLRSFFSIETYAAVIAEKDKDETDSGAKPGE